MERVSATQLTTYLMCPLKYSFRYIHRIPPAFKNSGLAFGSAVHSALNWFHDALLAGEHPDVEKVLKTFRADWQAEQVQDLQFKPGEDGAGLQVLGEKLLRIYCDEFKDIRVQAAEKKFQVPLIDPATGECFEPELMGYLDLVLADDVLVELKTAARSYNKDTIRRNVQFSSYSYAYRRVYGRDPKMRVVALLKQKHPRIETYPVERPASSDRWFVHLAASVARAVDAHAFPPCPGWQCKDCEYADTCSNWYEFPDQQPVQMSPAVNF